MNFTGYDWRERRNILNQSLPFNPMQYTISNYSTDCLNKKPETVFDDELLNRFHCIPDPLKKNLADTVITSQEQKKKPPKMPPEPQEFYYESNMGEEKMEGNRSDYYPSLAGITTFFSNFFGAISGAMFQKRAKTPAPQCHDCFDLDSDEIREMSLNSWPTSKFNDQNKNGAPERFSTVSNDNMNNSRATVAHVESKLNAVKSLLANKTAPNPPRFRSRRPRKVFVEPGSVEECFEDAFTPEDFVSLPNGEYVEYISVKNNQNHEFCEIDAPKMKTEVGVVREKTEIVKVIPEIPEKPEVSPVIINSSVDSKTEKQEVILSCEDKMAKLKSLLQEKCKKNTRSNLNTTHSAPELIVDQKVSERPKKPTKTAPIDKIHDKRFKNPNRLSTDKRKHTKLRKNIQEDMLFAQQIDSEEISSVENSPVTISTLERLSEPLSIQSVEQREYFDELKGRFHSSSATESDDSFQIVFTDSPKWSRMRRPSDCDSEDSFIVFEDSPDSCYTSNDVFGDHPTSEDSEGEYSDSNSDVSDSGCGIPGMKLSHNLSRTISDLTDDSLYVDRSADVVDCAVRKDFEEIPPEDVEDIQEDEVQEESVSEEKVLPSSMLTDAKKLSRKDQPPKKVSFSTAPPKVHVMRVWTFAARQARAGHWERHAVDRERFKRRIADVDMAVSWVLKPQHRSRVMFQRFMPWWNAQRRKEIAEKKLREAEKVRLEEEKRIAEEESVRDTIDDKIDTIVDKTDTIDDKTDTIADNTGKIDNVDVSDYTGNKNGVNEVKSKKSNAKIGGGKGDEIIAVNKKLADLDIDFAVKEEISGT